MEITEVSVRPVNDERLRAYVSITIEDALVIKDIKIVEGKNGLFVSMPSRRNKSGKYQDIAHPINTSFRKELERCIFDEYRKLVGAEVPSERKIEENADSDDASIQNSQEEVTEVSS